MLLRSQWSDWGLASNPSFQKGTSSRELTYPTLGKRNIIFKMPFFGDMLVPWRVHLPMMVIFHVLCLFAGK